MYGFEHNEIDPHNTVPLRTLKVLLRINLPELYPVLQGRIEQAFATELGNKGVLKSTFETGAGYGRILLTESTGTGWKSVSAFSLARSVTVHTNNQVFVGDQLSGLLLISLAFSTTHIR